MEIENSSSLVSRNLIKIIDLEGLVNSSSELWIKEKAAQLDEAMTGCGLALFINHGITEERLQAVHKVMDTFFAFPDEVKNLYKLGPPDYQQGYITAGSEQLAEKTQLEFRHCYNILRLSDNVPADLIPSFKEVIGDVVEEFLNITRLVLKLIAVPLELDPELFLSFHKGMMKEDNLTTLRPHYYPAVLGETKADITRCGEHTDWGTFTLLTQDSEGGLEVLINEEWNRVGDFPGAMLLNFGDMMELWTSSKYKAIKHRVVVPNDPELRTKSRHSLAFFVHPDNSTTTNPSFLTQCQPGKQVEKPKEHIPNAYEHAMKKRENSYININ